MLRLLWLFAIALLVTTGGGISYTEQEHPNTEESPGPIFYLSVPSPMEESMKKMVMDIYGTLKNNPATKQEKFTVRLEAISENFSRTMAGEITDKEGIFIAPIISPPATENTPAKIGRSYKKLGITPLIVVTAKSDKGLANLTSSSLRNIISGKADDWSKVSDKLTGKITVYAPFGLGILETVPLPDKIVLAEAQTSKIIKLVAEEKNSIAVIPLAGLTETELQRLNILRVDNILPTDGQAVLTGDYPYILPLYLFWTPKISKHPFFGEFNKRFNGETVRGYRIFQRDIILIRLAAEKSVRDDILTLFNSLGLPKDFAVYFPEQTGGMAKKGVTIWIGHIGEEEKMLSTYAGEWGFSHKKIGVVPRVAIIPKSSADLQNISAADLSGIITGKITDWTKISQKLSGKITVYRATQITDWAPAITTYREVINSVSQDKQGIGMVPLDSLTAPDKEKVSILSIDDILPTDSGAVKTGKYPLLSSAYLLWDKTIETDESSKKLLEGLTKSLADEVTLKKFSIYQAGSK
ncbi:MAG: hypothetical protein HZA49_09375 [Planctomycetes bacterium]|nr:hypothetical protein [Planctomycetota bacterium]